MESERNKLLLQLDAQSQKYNGILDAKESEFVKIHQENVALRLQIDEIRKGFALHSCPRANGFCWLCNASASVELIINRKPIKKAVREGDGHLCIAAEGIPCSLCGRVAQKPKADWHECHECGYKGDQAEHNEFTGCTAIARQPEKRVSESPKCFLCGGEAVGKVGAEPRCEAHI